MHAISALLLLAGPGAALIAQRPAPRQRHCNTLAATTADKKATRETRRQIKARKKASPTSLGDDLCLIPGEVVVRVDAAPGNARRIYTGVDISADVDTVWDLLTDYEGLADVVPNLVANEVIAKPPGGGGARLRQVGSAQVLPGVNFKASMVLDVAEVRGGLAAGQIRRGELDRVDAATEDGIRATEKKERLERGLFPRPWAAATSDPAFNRDITMVSNRIAGDLVKNLEAVAVEAAVRYRDAAEKRRRGQRRRRDGAGDAARAARAPAPAPAAEVPPPSKPTPQTETAVADAKAGLLAAVARVSDAGLGSRRRRSAATRGGAAVLLLAPPPGAPPAAPRSPRRSRGAKPVTEVDVATSAFRLFPRTTETLGRFALKSVDLDVRPGPNGDAVDTIRADVLAPDGGLPQPPHGLVVVTRTTICW
ncbi:polyketide cyclase / dehydrase [Aureococcus anophagefferens]|nr:polyketide cyclase / dehydrase [Aureococcus anophagefferens]